MFPMNPTCEEDKMKNILRYFKQKSTWQGLAGLAGVFGVVISPDQVEAIATAVVGVVSAIEVFRDEDKGGAA